MAGEVSTAAPAPGEFAASVSEMACGDGAVICTVSSALSGCYQAAAAGVRECMEEVEVIDSASAAGGQALVVLAAASAASAGGDVAAVAAAARETARWVRLVGVLKSVAQLVRSGRIPAVAGWTQDRLGMCPILEIRQGRIRRAIPALSPQSARHRILTVWRDSRPRASHVRLHVVGCHAHAASQAEDLLAAVAAEADPHVSFVADFPSSLVASAGLGALGLAWWWESVAA